MIRRGLTLLELLVVLVILVALATLIVPSIGELGRKSQAVTTRENLQRLQELLVNRYQADMGELPRPAPAVVTAGTRKNHPQLRYLFANPDTEDITHSTNANLLTSRHWRGPYNLHGGARYQLLTTLGFTDTYGLGDQGVRTDSGFVPGDPAVLDAWGRPVVIQEPCVAGNFTPTAEEKTYTRLVSAGADGKIDTPLNVLMPTATQRNDDIVLFLYRSDKHSEDFLRLDD